MDIISFLREQLGQASQFLEGTLDDVTDEQAHWLPASNANPLGATYAHLLTGEDGFVNGLLRGAAPLFATDWAGKVGVSQMPPQDPSWQEWGRQVRVDLAALRKYAQAVYASTDQYLASLNGADLTRTIDLSFAGLGERSLSWVLANGVLGHRLSHWGEICCLKGLQGAKGFPV